MLCPPPGDLPDPGIKPRSATLQADSLPSEPQIPALAAHPASGEEAGDAKALLRSLGDITPPGGMPGNFSGVGKAGQPGSGTSLLCSFSVWLIIITLC